MEEILVTQNERKLEKNKKKLFLSIGITILNMVLYIVAGNTNIKYPGTSEGPSLTSQLINFYIGFIFISVILGLLIAFIPNKKLKYLEKLIRSTLTIYLVLNILLLILTIRGIILFSFWPLLTNLKLATTPVIIHCGILSKKEI